MNRYHSIVCMVSFFCTLYGSSRPAMLPQQHLKDTSFEGIEDTTPGNWYEKLHWWREAKRLYTIDIQAAMEHLKNIARSYEEKKKSFFAQLEKARKSIPAEASQAITRIKTLLEELATEQERDHDEEEIALQKKLESLQQNFEHFSVLSQRVEEAYTKVLTEQVKAAEQYEEKALSNFEQIEDVFDDRRAHEYYLIVENSLENIQAIITYLSGPFYLFTEQTTARVMQLTPRIKTALDELEEEGVYIRILSEEEKAEKAAAEQKKEEERLKAEARKKEEAEIKNRPWWRSLIMSISSFFANLWNSLTGLFRSVPQQPAQKKPVPPQQPKPTLPQQKVAPLPVQLPVQRK